MTHNDDLVNLELAAGEAGYEREVAQREVGRLTAQLKYVQDEARHQCDSLDRIRFAAKVGPDTHVDDLIDAVAELTRERDEARTANERLSRRLAGRFENQAKLRALLASIWLYVNWRYVTKQITTEQKELWADAVESSSLTTHPDEPSTVDRWWRSAAQEAGESPAPRVFHDDQIPADVAELVDRNGTMWRRVRDREFMWQCDSLLYGIASVVKDFGPLAEVLEGGDTR